MSLNTTNEKNPNLYILNTYGMNNPDEGLSVVYHSIKSLGIEINNSSNIINKKVFIAGMPDNRYLPFLNKQNINIIYTTYEFSPIPKLWVDVLNNWYSIVIVPHEEVRKMFIDSGVKKQIYVVQQGCPIRKNILHSLTDREKKFTIGFLGVPAKRKNLELLIESIEILKNKIPNIVLKVHISKYYREMTPIVFPNNDHFIVSYGYINDDEMNKLFNKMTPKQQNYILSIENKEKQNEEIKKTGQGIMDYESTHMNEKKEIPKQGNILIDESLRFDTVKNDNEEKKEDETDGKKENAEEVGEVRKIVIT